MVPIDKTFEKECFICSGAATWDGVIHLVFKHDFLNLAGSHAIDLRVIRR